MTSDEYTNAGLSEDQKRVLASVLDELIPPRPDGKLPGAGQLGLVAFIDTALQKAPELRLVIAQGLSDLEMLARDRNLQGFTALSREDKVELLTQQGFVFPLMMQAYTAYYQQPRVLEALGLEPRPPHPKGYHMEPNDLSLLEPVRQRPRLYREC